MQNKKVLLVILSAVLLCLFINLLAKNIYCFGFFNSVLLGATLTFIYLADNKLFKLPLLFILTLSLIPLFSFVPTQTFLYFLVALSMLFWLAAIRFPIHKHIFIVTGFIIFIYGTLISNNLITPYFKTNPERFIWSVPETNQAIITHQQSSFYTVYRLRILLYNKGIYIYSALTSIAGLLNLKNLYDTLLLANIYPLVLGLQESLKNRRKLINKIALWVLIFTLFFAGITRSPDKFASLFIAAPILTFLIMSGFQRINKLIYVLLFIFSIILLSAPI